MSRVSSQRVTLLEFGSFLRSFTVVALVMTAVRSWHKMMHGVLVLAVAVLTIAHPILALTIDRGCPEH